MKKSTSISKSRTSIIYSKSISRLPDSTLSQKMLPILDEEVIYPRVFPSSTVPLKVAIARKTKKYETFNLETGINLN